MAKYEPYLIGAFHTPEYIDEVCRYILGLGVKSVGVEIAKYFLSPARKSGTEAKVILFWKEAIKKLRKDGIRIVYLTPDSFARQIYWKEAAYGMEKPEITTRFTALVRHTQNRLMERTALKKRPRALLVGLGHDLPMRKDLRIPKHKCRSFGYTPGKMSLILEQMFGGVPKPYFTTKEMLKQVRGLRRFQRLRRKQRAQRIHAAKKRRTN